MSTPRSAFGLAVETAVALPGPWAAAVGGEPVLRLVPAPLDEIEHGWSGDARDGWRGVSDGRLFEARAGAAGDLLMTHGSLTAWLEADGTTLRVHGDLADPVVLRPLLDSVLFTVGLWLGMDALHAGAVRIPEGILAVTGPSGSGKSSLIAALRAEGAEFFTDDVLALTDDGAFPGPPLTTVPDRAGAGGGAVVATLDGERWMTAPRPPAGPIDLAGVIALEPSPRPPWAALLDGLLNFPTGEQARARRAGLALDLAAKTPVLSIPPHDATPHIMARKVLKWATGG